ncbi:zf-BED domain-containing protein [Tanacetum coccineum]
MNSSSASAPSSSSAPSSANSRKSKRVNAPGARTDVVSGAPRVFRFKHHLARTHKDASACPMVPEDIKVTFQKLVEQMELAASKKRKLFSVDGDEELLESDDRPRHTDTFVSKKGKVQSTLNKIYKKDERDKVCQQIARFFYTSALSFNCVKNPEFKKMIQMVGDFGRGLDPPSYHEMRVTYLKKEVDYTKALLEDYKKEWKKQEKVFAMLDDFVEKVGEEHVVQVVTDNAANYKAAGEMLMNKRKKLFWTPCAAHCIDMMLEDLGKELLRPGATRFSTSYLTLGRLHELKGFWGSVSTCLLVAIPLINVLRMVDSNSTPAMGFIYQAMKKAKKEIISNYKDVQSSAFEILSGREENKMTKTAAAIDQLEALDFENVESDDEWITEEESTQSQAHNRGRDDEFEEPDFDLHDANEVKSAHSNIIM